MGRWHLLAGLVISALAIAQNTGRVDGEIMSSSTRAPVPGVMVTLTDRSPGGKTTYRDTTDVSGRFHISEIPEGAYTLAFGKVGWRQTPLIPRPIHVSKGEKVSLTLEMEQMGVLRGRVVDAESRPAAGARIELAHLRGGSAAVANADAEGRFEITASGVFTLLARPREEQNTAKTTPLEREFILAPTYYPRAIRREGATRMVLRPGEQVEGYEIKLREVPVYSIRGVVQDEVGKPVANARVRLFAPDSWNGATESETNSSSDGTFQLTRVWPRDWELEARAKRGSIELAGGGATTISRDHVDGLYIRVSPPFAVRGSVEGVDGAAANRSVRVVLHSVDRDSRIGSPDESGSLRIEKVYPGMYRIAPVGEHPGYYLGSVSLGAREVTGQPVYLFDGGEPFRIVLKPNPALIQGVVKDCRDCAVVLWNLDEPVLDSEYFRRTSSGDGGRFTFGDLRPGHYYVVAFTRVGDATLLPDLEFAREMVERATRVRAEEGQTVYLELTALEWPR